MEFQKKKGEGRILVAENIPNLGRELTEYPSSKLIDRPIISMHKDLIQNTL